jgi:hypothetical protein
MSSLNELFAKGRIISVTIPSRENPVIRSTLPGSLQQFVSRLEARLAPIYDSLSNPSSRDDDDITKKTALLSVAKHILEHGYICYGQAAQLYIETCMKFTDHINLLYSLGVQPPAISNFNRVRLQVLAVLPVIKLDYRMIGQAGVAPAILIANIPGIQNEDLETHLAPVCKLLDFLDSKTASGQFLTKENMQLIKRAMPSTVSPLVDFIVFKAGGSAVAAELGIDKYR